uniref:HicB family protein n=1 Tax=Candidatus Kentrum sp. FM TaxID=2126340 RepID=A0A450VRL1_9GAMM|nr:MAG: hypothetical protein BECKFM1743A_GA0114220_100295 [Candidatus Kentron sp. FM]VFJ45956.1 MAG: hypothetical protein BECKFM1743C_GA0114222_100325 [Candidatus Kentron sp. FM]VFK07398.1 MAG: hypothetical protein BECKFM1743B_GA0114221_100405 [Candidatus Kentron sp. FM]
MTQLNIEIPNRIYRGIRDLSEREHISLDRLVAQALGEKLSAVASEDYLARRAERGNRERFLAVLDKAPDIQPEEDDR